MNGDKKQWGQIITKSILKKEYLSGKSWKSIAENYGCGETTIMRLASKYNLKSRKRAYDLCGQKFGKLLVIEKKPSNKRNHSMWLCICDCGKETITMGGSLIQGATKSCGCLVHETLWKGFEEISGSYWGRCERGANNRGLKFNLSIKDAWKKFLDQNRKCALSGRILLFNPKYCDPRYSGPEWQTASLDRIDSNKGYSIDNIQWVHVSVNYMKMDINQSDFIKLCIDIANFST